MTMETYNIAIIGAGPAGLSAACHAAALDAADKVSQPSYIVLEGFPAVAKTIQRYQKGKFVMAEPGFLDLRSDVRFAAGTREEILGNWQADAEKLGVHMRCNAEVRKVTGSRGAFEIKLTDGSALNARHIVLAIGLEGNPRALGCPGEVAAKVQYQLDDPKEYRDEVILVVGAGDAAIENAVALTAQNEVVVINRGKEFSRAKEGNLSAIIAAIANPSSRLKCNYECSIKELVIGDAPKQRIQAQLNLPTGVVTVNCDRIIARLGSVAPRQFVESMGIKFPNDRPDAIPDLTGEYESNVPGIYVVGSLAGYPLIKQAMNQGYDVVEFIRGNKVKPADTPLIEQRVSLLPFNMDAESLLPRLKARIPMFGRLNALAFREIIIESEMIAAYPEGRLFAEATKRGRAESAAIEKKNRKPRVTQVISEGERIYAAGEFGTSLFTIINGEVILTSTDKTPLMSRLSAGEFFGETSLLSGRPRLETATAGAGCVVVETPRRTMVKLMNSNEEVRAGIEWIFVVRELQKHFAPRAPARELRDIASRVSLRRLKVGDALYRESERGDCLYLVRSGGLKLTRKRDGSEAMVAQIRSGELIGQMALMGDPVRRETAVATVATEIIGIGQREFHELTRREDAEFTQLQDEASRRVVENERLNARPEAARVMNFLMGEGLGEATDVLVINEDLCVGCDNCEKACAETHNGISRLQRAAGASLARVHIPISCRHCEQPHCMKDCPPNAIKRAPTGEVFIDDSCIGCGNCEKNCPYDAIKLAYQAPPKPGLLSWLLLGRGPGPGEEPDYHPSAAAKAKGKKAVKCDACLGREQGPACVSACPTGAAMRIGPSQFLSLIEERKR
jgi:Fe-S-cluster-containing hydrogenase component 2/thioredoxin reductase/CRP-like cAMP-binding protein